MTTLIFLCLALIGAGVFLFAPQVRVQIVGGLPLKLLCLVMIGCMILPAKQVQAKEAPTLAICVAYTTSDVYMISLPSGTMPRSKSATKISGFNHDKADGGVFEGKGGLFWARIVTSYLKDGFRVIDTDFPHMAGGRGKCYLLQKK